MILQKMYPPQKDSPGTFLSGDITATDTLINVGSSFILPQTVPYPLTLGFDKSITETVIVTDIGSGNNQLTVERPEGALFWPAGTKCARVFTADDLQSIQINVHTIAEQSDTDHDLLAEINPQVESNTTAIGDLEDVLTGMIGDVATDLSSEVVRATGVESTLDTNKINRSELPQVITNWAYSADGSALLVTITRYNASNKTTSEFTKTIPLVNSEAVGAMTPEAYNEITALRNDVNTLINQGGKFIGISFASKSGLDSYIVPTTVKMGDYTYVLDDETHDDALTRYIYSGESWNFSFVINYDPVGLADSTTPGLVKSDGGSTDGKVFVETDGSMSVIGWDDLNSAINTINTETIPNTQTFQTASGTATAITLTNVSLVQGRSITFIAIANNGGAATTINTKPAFKPGGTAAPNIIAGKAYTFWYDTGSGGRFFIKASAEGNAIADNVLAGKTFSNDDDNGLVGTMAVAPTFPNENNAQEVHYYGTNMNSSHDNNNVYVNVPKGYYDGTWLGFSEPNLIPANVKAGVAIGINKMFKVTGAFTSDATATAGDILSGKTAYSNGSKLTGAMSDNGTTNHTLPINGTYTIPAGKHSGSGKVTQNITTKGAQTYTPSTANQTIAGGQYLSGTQTIAGSANLVSANIKAGANIFGVAGNSNVVDTSAGDAVAGNILSGKKAYVDGALVTGNIPSKAAATITPSASNQTISAGLYLSGAQTILGDADLISANILSGKNIFGVAGSVVAGKKFASGTVVASASNGVFEAVGSTATNSMPWIRVSGLTFKPSFIYTVYAEGEIVSYSTYDEIPSSGYLKTVKISLVNQFGTASVGTNHLKGDVRDAYVNTTGFKIPVGYSKSYTWFAWE